MKYLLYVVITLGIVALFSCNGRDSIPSETPNGEYEVVNKEDNREWIGAWTASMQAPFEDGVSYNGFNKQTIRMVIRPHLAGSKMRIRLSNVFGVNPLTIDEAYVAISKNGADVDSKTSQQVTFFNQNSITIEPGKKVYSDPISIEVNDDNNIAISLYVNQATGPTTWHPRSLQTTYISNGNHASNASGSSFQMEEEAWFWLDGVDIIPNYDVEGAIVVVGDSIANGNHSTKNKNRRWPDYLAKRFIHESPDTRMSILNAGISANQLINSAEGKGENALARLERDVFSHTGVKGVILHQGLNDIRHHPEYTAEKIIKRMREIIAATHQQGINIYGATLTPFKGSELFTKNGEQTRQVVNEWIRTSEEFDGVIDFDKALRNPESPKHLLPVYNAGDNFHPNDEGYKRMAESVELSIFN